MELIIISFIAGVLTVLAPCILPLLPVIVGGSLAEQDKKRPIIITASLAVSVILFTLLLKVSTAFIDIPQDFWTWFSAGIIFIFAITLLFPKAWPAVSAFIKKHVGKDSGTGGKAQKTLFKFHEKKGVWPSVVLGGALGPVFASCSPTYFLILGTVLPASFAVGLINLVAYAAGLGLVMLLIAFAGQRVMKTLNVAADPNGWFKKAMGILFLAVAIFIAGGYDKKLSARLLENGNLGVVEFEQRLLDSLDEKEEKEREEDKISELVEPLTIEQAMKEYPEIKKENLQVITLAGGCFWCIEGAFQEKDGVISAISGYMGDSEDNAEYRKVANGQTKHREVVQIIYDSSVVSTQEIINHFLQQIDPTDAGGQFADRGFQYTTAILFENEEQQNIAQESLEKLRQSNLFEKDIVVEVLPAREFYVAEEYHQNYYLKAAEHYRLYSEASGRKGFVKDNWAREAALEHFENQEK